MRRLEVQGIARRLNGTRYFGNAPTRVRPNEIAPRRLYFLNKEEISATSAVVVYVTVILWGIIVAYDTVSRQHDAQLSWIEGYRAKQDLKDVSS